MKKIITLLLIIGVIACKKEAQQPSTPQQQTTTPPPNPTDTTGNGNDTLTSIDTTNKVKVLYNFYFYPKQTNAYDFKQVASNFHFYHNSTPLIDNYINYFYSDSLELSSIGNYDVNSFGAINKSIWCNHGDSIVVVVDSLEFLPSIYVTETVYNQAFLKALITIKTTDYSRPYSFINTTEKFYPMQDYLSSSIAKQFPASRSNYEFYYWASAINLGQEFGSASGFVYYLGGSYRFVYYIQ